MAKRSLRENRYYFGVVIKALREKAKAEGNPVSKDEAHRLAMLAIGHCAYRKRWGVVSLEPKQTHNLETWEFEELLEKVRCWAAQQLKIDIELPNEGIAYPAFIGDDARL
jgi:hypothetical protein